MIRIPFVKSGKHEDSVTKSTDADEALISKLVSGHKLKFLGTTLQPIGESRPMSDFTGPDFVVLYAERVRLAGCDPARAVFSCRFVAIKRESLKRTGYDPGGILCKCIWVRALGRGHLARVKRKS